MSLDEMMTHFAQSCAIRHSCPNAHFLEYLPRISRNNLSIKFLRNLNCHISLARSGWSEDYNESFFHDCLRYKTTENWRVIQE